MDSSLRDKLNDCLGAGAMRAGVNYYRATFRSPDARALWPHWLRRFVHGDQPIEGVESESVGGCSASGAGFAGVARRRGMSFSRLMVLRT